MREMNGLEKRYTYQDYLKLDDGRDYEVIGGKLIAEPRPRPQHQEIVGNLVVVLKTFTRQKQIGKIYSDVDVIFGEQVVSPDIILILQDRYQIITETSVQGPPDLVAEVLSPSTAKYDRKEKSRLYFENGVKEYWILDPAIQLVEVFVRGDKDWNRAGAYDENDTFTSPLLPDLKVNMQEIFSSGAPGT